ncbi:hypothetical protein NCCP28_23920 [Niallia sp. NCCP-28]|nr:hypothetical protein NCCP28_23920 [Niallia sp. NCCP-28]
MKKNMVEKGHRSLMEWYVFNDLLGYRELSLHIVALKRIVLKIKNLFFIYNKK